MEEKKVWPTSRTTFDQISEIILPASGIYIVAYMGKIIYVGKSKNLTHRIPAHIYSADRNYEYLGRWLLINRDHENIRIDILGTPHDVVDEDVWLKKTEARCVQQFRPLFNTQQI